MSQVTISLEDYLELKEKSEKTEAAIAKEANRLFDSWKLTRRFPLPGMWLAFIVGILLGANIRL